MTNRTCTGNIPGTGSRIGTRAGTRLRCTGQNTWRELHAGYSTSGGHVNPPDMGTFADSRETCQPVLATEMETEGEEDHCCEHLVSVVEEGGHVEDQHQGHVDTAPL